MVATVPQRLYSTQIFYKNTERERERKGEEKTCLKEICLLPSFLDRCLKIFVASIIFVVGVLTYLAVVWCGKRKWRKKKRNRKWRKKKRKRKKAGLGFRGRRTIVQKVKCLF